MFRRLALFEKQALCRNLDMAGKTIEANQIFFFQSRADTEKPDTAFCAGLSGFLSAASGRDRESLFLRFRHV